ncbi:SusC/RagA family TonB-linked outer membrane protein [Saccharicrinis sp. FJH54]|uniref:SusC/RagA family TonB-linked outer membrane protein n=1 Tax=Saccharicrinis sp. FJH54 TaxID=3344665 RepID=UPI0035D47F4B
MRLKTFLLLLGILMSFTFKGQVRTVTGVVTSAEDNSPIPGVTVVLEGTSSGSITDVDGKYSIEVPANAKVLVFSFVGMETQYVDVSGKTVLNVTLKPANINIEELVVTAMGIKREAKALGYATSQVSSDDIMKSGEQNAIQALSAKASGVQVVSSAGVPGASSKIIIRGSSSFTGNNQPLIVVDGVPIDNSTIQTVAGDNPYNKDLEGVDPSNGALDINPADVESVTILKGPAAAALYGVRAANGAIVYTTKRGSKGKIRASYDYSLELSEVNKLPEFQNVYSQGSNGEFGMDTYVSWGARLSDLGIQPTDNVDNFFRTGVSHIHNFSVSGGDEKGSLRLSIGNSTLEGIIPNTYYDRTSARLTGDADVAPGLKINGTAAYIKSGGNKAQKGSNLAGLMLSLFRTPVSYNLNDPAEGGYETPEGVQRKYIDYFDNPYWSAYNNTFKNSQDRFMGNTGFNYNYKWLTLDYKVGIDFYTDSRKGIIALGSNGGDAGDGLGEVTENMKRNREFYSNFILSAKHKFGKNLLGNLSLGHNLNEQFYQNLFGRARNLSAPDFYNLSNGSDLYSYEEQYTVRTAALFFVADLEWQDMLFLNVTGRNEWASTLGSAKKDFFYPSVTGSFVFSEVLPENNVLSFGKARLGWAKAGNNPQAYKYTYEAYRTQTYYTQPSVAAGMTNGLGWPYLGQNGFTRSATMGNDELRPELTTGIEGGLDLRFFNGRIYTDLTYYHQTTTDILVQRPIASTSGYQYIWENSGEMVNKGIEVTLGITPVKSAQFRWDIIGNFSRNVNEVLKLNDAVDAEGNPVVKEIEIESAFTGFGSYAIVGKPYGALYSDMWLRDDNGLMVCDAEGYPIIADNRGYVGNPFPDWMANIRNTFQYQNLSLSFLLDIRQGGDLWGGTIARLNQIGRTAITADREGTIIVEGVKEDGTPNDVPITKEDYYRYVLGDWGPGENARYDGSWIRLRDLSLSYKYRTKGTVSNYIKDITLTATGRNLWLKTDYPGVDPETSLTGAGSNLNGFDYFNMPGTKSYLFSVKVNF